MKNKFSKHWKSSKQKRKQIKFRFNADNKTKERFISANLSKDLRKKYARRSFKLRKGDEVKVLTGSFKGKSGKVDIVDLKNLKIIIAGIQRTKKDGTKINIKFDPSNLQIQQLNLEDKKRIESIEKKDLNKSKGENKNAS